MYSTDWLTGLWHVCVCACMCVCVCVHTCMYSVCLFGKVRKEERKEKSKRRVGRREGGDATPYGGHHNRGGSHCPRVTQAGHLGSPLISSPMNSSFFHPLVHHRIQPSLPSLYGKEHSGKEETKLKKYPPAPLLLSLPLFSPSDNTKTLGAQNLSGRLHT